MSNNKNKKIKMTSLFNNDRFLLVISFVISFFIWVAVSANSGETVDYPVSDIPATMELSEDAQNDNLTVVSINGVPVDEFSATVKVKGNGVTVGSLSSTDIQVYGSNLGNIVTSGSYNVTLMARQLGVKNNYDIISVEPSDVTVVVDRNVTKELAIDASQIVASAPAEYYVGSPALSEKNVTLSGPEQNVSKVQKAIVYADIENELLETTVFSNLDVILLDANNNKIEDDSIVIDPITVDVTIPILMKKTVPLVLEYENEPSLFDPNGFINLEPAEIEIAAASDIIDTVDSIKVGPLDFSELSYGMPSMSFEIVMPEGFKNFNNIEKTVANFNFTDYSTKSFVVTDFDFENIPEGLGAQYSSYRNIVVRIVGPKASVSALKASEVRTSIDLTDAKSGTTDMPVTVTINKKTPCWVYGHYNINVTVGDALSFVSSPSAASSIVSKTENNSDYGEESEQ